MLIETSIGKSCYGFLGSGYTSTVSVVDFIINLWDGLVHFRCPILDDSLMRANNLLERVGIKSRGLSRTPRTDARDGGSTLPPATIGYLRHHWILIDHCRALALLVAAWIG